MHVILSGREEYTHGSAPLPHNECNTRARANPNTSAPPRLCVENDPPNSTEAP
jgi:hypothetical protein